MSKNIISKVIEDIRRGSPGSIDAYLRTVVKAFALDGTQTKFYTHLIALDGNGNARLDDFIEFVVRHIVEYVIPRGKIEEAKTKDTAEKVSTHTVRLFREAEKLFTPLKTSGEGGEMLLFILGEVLLGLPQLFCKMSVKTSGSMHYHGADGIHAGIGEDGKLELYWGESKLYKDFNGGANSCIDCLSPFLKRDTGADYEDLLLLQTHLDLHRPEYTEAVKAILNKDNPEFNNVRYCGLCFIGFDKDLYTKETTEEIINSCCEEWKNNINSKLKGKGLAEFSIHFFCLPVVSVEDFRNRFLEKLGLKNG